MNKLFHILILDFRKTTLFLLLFFYSGIFRSQSFSKDTLLLSNKIKQGEQKLAENDMQGLNDLNEADSLYALFSAKHRIPLYPFHLRIQRARGTLFFNQGDYAQCEIFFVSALETARKIKDAALLAEVVNETGTIFYNTGKFNKALELFHEAEKLFIGLKNTSMLGSVYANLGTGYSGIGDIPKAFAYLEKALKEKEIEGDTIGIASSLNNLAAIMQLQGNTDAALNYFKRSIVLMQNSKLKKFLANSHNNLAQIYNAKKMDSLSLVHFYAALEIRSSENDQNGIASSYHNLGVFMQDRKRYDEALEYMSKSIAIREQLKNDLGICTGLAQIASLYISMNKVKEALETGERSLKIAIQLGIPQRIANSARIMKDVYRVAGKIDQALDAYELYIQMNDSIINENNRKTGVRSQLKYEYEKKAAADSTRRSQEEKIIEAKLEAEKTQRIALYAGLSLVLLFALFMLNRFMITRKQKKLIEEQTKTVALQKHLVEVKQAELLDSIRYAKRIQNALLASDFYIERELKRIHKN